MLIRNLEQGTRDGQLHQIAGVLIVVVVQRPLDGGFDFDGFHIGIRQRRKVAAVEASGLHQPGRADLQLQGVAVQLLRSPISQIDFHAILRGHDRIQRLHEEIQVVVILGRADGGLRLRSGPGESYEKLLTVPDGTVLPCISQGDGWVKTTYNGKTGYVSQDYLLVPVTVRASTGLNLRSSASETAEKLLTIPNGTVVQCYGNKENEWARVAYNGKAGYVSYLYIAYD